jgi:hypothetical protein
MPIRRVLKGPIYRSRSMMLGGFRLGGTVKSVPRGRLRRGIKALVERFL